MAFQDERLAVHLIGPKPLPTTILSKDERSRGSVAFLPDFTEHPKPKRRKTGQSQTKQSSNLSQSPTFDNSNLPDEEQGDDVDDITFFHDFVAGGVAGSASVIIGHPFDTIKVRLQTASANSHHGMIAMLSDHGILSLYRGMAAPLSAATVVNAVVFGSYGLSSRFYDSYFSANSNNSNSSEDAPRHDPWQKSMTCGAFAGLVQSTIICPMEHIKCRLQIHSNTANGYKGPVDAIRRITQQYGPRKLFQGWWSTCSREVPSFGMYFASYDYLKDKALDYFEQQSRITQTHNKDRAITATTPYQPTHTQTILSSAFAGGMAGCITWASVYPVDVVKTHIQTSPLDATHQELQMIRVASTLLKQHGWRYLFRGLEVTLLRAFPGTSTNTVHVRRCLSFVWRIAF